MEVIIASNCTLFAKKCFFGRFLRKFAIWPGSGAYWSAGLVESPARCSAGASFQNPPQIDPELEGRPETTQRAEGASLATSPTSCESSRTGTELGNNPAREGCIASDDENTSSSSIYNRFRNYNSARFSTNGKAQWICRLSAISFEPKRE